MYFWKDKQLAEELKAGAVSERSAFWYFYVWVVGITAALTYTVGDYLYGYMMLNFWDYASDVVLLGSTAFAAIVFFRINESGDNRDFIKRYICLSIPVMVRSVVFVGVPYGLIVTSLGFFFIDDCTASLPKTFCEQYVDFDGEYLESTILEFVMMLAGCAYCWVRMHILFKHINRKAV